MTQAVEQMSRWVVTGGSVVAVILIALVVWGHVRYRACVSDQHAWEASHPTPRIIIGRDPDPEPVCNRSLVDRAERLIGGRES